ncbi:hypothetical protein I3843_04G013100 [Carya illinoinensis]|nr:hypothetical protein I3843_04G013100 [Carya illinoinensis]
MAATATLETYEIPTLMRTFLRHQPPTHSPKLYFYLFIPSFCQPNFPLISLVFVLGCNASLFCWFFPLSSIFQFNGGQAVRSWFSCFHSCKTHLPHGPPDQAKFFLLGSKARA